MCWTTIEISGSQDLLAKLLSFDSAWSFRGHARASWRLESTLERFLSPIGWDSNLAQHAEDYALYTFRSKAPHYISTDLLPNSKLGWLSLMQHHGAPTRLMDFTASPFIALFFAFESVSPDQDDACAVWAINHRLLMKASIKLLKNAIADFKYEYKDVPLFPDEIFDGYVDCSTHDILWVTEPLLRSLRLERQKGTFLLSGNIRKRILDILPCLLPPDAVQKIVIPASLMHDVFGMLSAMGIDNERLFSNLDGLGSDVRRMLAHQIPNKCIEAKGEVAGLQQG